MGIFRMYTGPDVTGKGHKTRFPVPSVSISMPLPG